MAGEDDAPAAQGPEQPQQIQVPVQQSIQYVYASDNIKPPTLDWDSNDMPQQYKKFRRYCELMLSTPAFSNKNGSEIVSYILLWMGPQAVEIFDNWSNISDAEKNDPKRIWDLFQQYFEPKANFRLARFQLRDLRQESHEPIDKFIIRLRAQAVKCNFANPNNTDDNILDQLIKGTAHSQVRKKLLDLDPATLTLDRAVEISRTFEATETQLQHFNTETNVSAIKKHTGQKKQATHQNKNKPKEQFNNDKDKKSGCFNCGRSHDRKEDCPARKSQCHKCKRLGHWASVCLNPNNPLKQQPNNQKQQSHKKSRNFHAIDHNNHESSSNQDPTFETLTFEVIRVNVHSNQTKQKTEAKATIQIEVAENITTNLRGKIDTGAEGNILPMRIYQQMQKIQPFQANIRHSNAILTDYNGGTIHHHGIITFPCTFQDIKRDEEFYLADTNGQVLFGLNTCEHLGMVKLQCSVETTPQCIKNLDDLIKIYPDQFKGIGHFQKPYHLTLEDNAQPVKHPPRKAPIQLREKIQAELKRMIDLDVIRPVNEPTDWVSSITYVMKEDGSLRICLDPRDLNKALKRGQHHTPTIEELSHKFAGATVFSKLDARSGYWAVPLDQESQVLTTFNSPFGRFCFKRLPFGLKTSQDVFQHAMDEILQDLQGVVSIADDITVFGNTEAEHDNNMSQLMKRAQKTGLVFNPGKCKLKASEVKFFGNIYSKEGVKPDPKKVEAIVKLKEPSNKQELQTFLGMITYLSAYIPRLSDHTHHLRQLLQKDAEFQWHNEQQVAFDNLKQLITNASALQYFDPTKPSVVQVDASLNALGAALIQDDKVIAYAAKSLTETETRYANNERELLACVFGAERFHTYLYGAPFVIESDHQPLEMITKKSLAAAPARLQRMLLRLQRYDYSIKYRPGKEMILADGLSRLPTSIESPQIPLNIQVCFVQFSGQKLEEIKEATKQDNTLHQLMKYIFQGFPPRQRDLHKDIKPYWSFRDELSLENGMILKGEQIIIPAKLQKDYLEAIHSGHQGIIRCQGRARSSVYWPGINKDIEELVTTCQKCQEYQASQTKEALMPIDYPPIPWHTIGTDLFMHNNQWYLIIADYHSKYPVVEKLSSLSSKNVTEITNKVFCMMGYPHTIISDNGPQFIGHEYKEMTNENGIIHQTSSPHHPKSHGFIERMIRTVKCIFNKTNKQQPSLLIYRTTPIGPKLPSPAEILFGRKIQCNLPVHVKSNTTEEQRIQQEASRSYGENRYNLHSKPLDELEVDDKIYYQDVAKRTWAPGTIVGKGPEPRSYTIRCKDSGRFLARNRVLLRPRAEENQMQPCQWSQPVQDLDPPVPSQMSTPPTVTPMVPATTSPSAPTESSPTPNPPVTTPSKDNAYRTRSGRVSRPPQRLIEQ